MVGRYGAGISKELRYKHVRTNVRVSVPVEQQVLSLPGDGCTDWECAESAF
jgi:hypothetical protein